jgi:rod shape-determining protein MreC
MIVSGTIASRPLFDSMAFSLAIRRPRTLLGGVLGLYFVLLSFQARNAETGRSRIEEWTTVAIRPLVAGTSTLVELGRDATTGVVDLRAAAIENSRLRERLRDRELELARLRGLEGEVARLEALLSYRDTTAPAGVLARVVYTDTRGWFKSALIDRGTEAGLERGSAVLAAKGLVGRVVLATPGLSKIQLLVDSNASVGCLVERNRIQGVARGDGGTGLTIRYVPRIADVRVGDRIVTAGNDGIYPAGIEIGAVVHSAEGEGMFREIRLRPSVEFTTLEVLLALPPLRIDPVTRDYQP